MVRVVAPSRWSAERLLGVKGTPYRLRPQNPDETVTFVEEMREPHRGGDDLPADRDGDQNRAPAPRKPEDSSPG